MGSSLCSKYGVRLTLVGICLLVSNVGCQSLKIKDNRFNCGLFSCKTDRNEAEKRRQTYQSERDPESICWLLAHEVHSGMMLEEVNQVLGENGVREENSQWITTKGGNYRADDVAYRWGPDSEGGTVYLIFREDRLVNFDAATFKDRLKKDMSNAPKFLN
ncbi:MAG: hypothetical protein O2955_17490 [Planctomycetota bacterium]|jgi:hypothetical protein|nr:hypothetical protein [Planctomycetota bacterium]MDA1214305.1 hypothetical protein [Planctomycetota bacterium]